MQTADNRKNTMRSHYEEIALIHGSAKQVFAVVDNPAGLSSHMSQGSWVMGGGSMKTEVDDGKGQAVGSHIRLSGKVFGIGLFVDAVVTLREPPHRKVSETVGTPRLLVISNYRLSLDINDEDGMSRLHVFIDYELSKGMTRLLGYLFGRAYAKWCVRQIIKDAGEQFKTQRA